MAGLLFGTGGAPPSSKGRDAISGIQRITELKLDAMELEFVYGVKMGLPEAEKVGKFAEQQGVPLSAHGPYYMNLLSQKPQTRGASRTRLVQCAAVGEKAGLRFVSFHAGFFQGMEEKQAEKEMEEQIRKTIDELDKKGLHKTLLAPEITGKKSQFGSIAMLERLSDAFPKRVWVCFDWSHLHARENGRFKKKEDFLEALEEIDQKFHKNMYIQASGICFTEKGEKSHLMLQDRANTFNYKWFLEALKEKKVSGTIICESPDPEKDALLMKKYYGSL